MLFPVYVPGNKVLNVEFPAYKTIYDLKIHVAEITGIPYQKLRFIGANAITDNTKLNELDINQGTKLQAIIKEDIDANINFLKIDYTYPELPNSLTNFNNFRSFCSGSNGKTHDYVLQPSSLRPICRTCNSKNDNNVNQETVTSFGAASWNDIKLSQVKGFCFNCNPEYFDIPDDQLPINTQIQSYNRCHGTIYDGFTRIAILPVTSNNLEIKCDLLNNKEFSISTNQVQDNDIDKDKNIEERCSLQELLVKLQEYVSDYSIIPLSANKIPTYNYKKAIRSTNPGSYIIAIHNDNPSKYLCDILPLQPSENHINLHVVSRYGNHVNQIFPASSTIGELKKCIGDLYLTNYEDFSLYFARPITVNTERKLNEYFASHLVFGISKGTRCSGKSLESGVVSMIDLIPIPVTEACPLSYDNFHQGFGFIASCGHKISIDGYYDYISSHTMTQIIAINTNEITKQSYEYLVKCPLCDKGGLTINSLRLYYKQYQTALRWAVTAECIANGYIFCGLPTHEGVPRFKPDKIDPDCMMIHCPICDVDICRKHGTEWKLGRCECLPDEGAKIRKEIENILTKATFVNCPRCQAQIQRESKCMRMKCKQVLENGKQCLTYFCYFCETLIDQKDPYSHFWNDNATCPLFLDEHLLFRDIEDGDARTEALYRWKTLRLLKELSNKYSKEEWEEALQNNQNLLIHDNFNFIDELSKYPPNIPDSKFNLP